MLLKKIEIFGFKSFAVRQKILFDQGITALLGPNGCGKSNIVDAIKWVLGEQSAKVLRAQSMSDLIFGGTQTKKALNAADVTLVLDNSSQLIDLPYHDIEIRRRLFRDGESEYYINNKQVKLKELRDIFYNTGLSKSLYSIIEQGKIDQALSIRSEDRRALFEEAAGLSRHKIQSLEASNRLEKTAQNIKEAEHVLFEVKKQYDVLKEQAEATQKYRQLNGGINNFRHQLLSFSINQKREEAFRKEETCRQEQQVYDRQFTQLNKEHEEQNKRRHDLQDQQQALLSQRQEIFALELEQKSRLEEQLSLEELKKEAEKLQSAALERKTAGEQELDKLSKQLSIEREATELQKQQHLSALKQIDQYNESLKRLQLLLTEAHKAKTERQQKKTEYQSRLDRLLEQDKTLTDDLIGRFKQLLETGFSRKEKRHLEQSLDKGLKMLALNLETFKSMLVLPPKGSDRFYQQMKTVADDLELNFTEAVKAWERYGQMGQLWDNFFQNDSLLSDKIHLDRQIAESKQQLTELSLAEEQKELEVKDFEKQINTLNEQMTSAKIQESRYKAELDALLNSLKKTDENVALSRSRLVLLTKDEQERSSEVSRRQQKIADSQNKYQDAVKKYQELQKIAEKVSNASEKSLEVIDDQEQQNKELKEALEHQKEKITRLQIEKENLDHELKKMREAFLEEFGLTEEIPADKQVLTPDELKKQISLYKKELEALGAVNLLAIEEFAEISKRYNFLNEQLEDLRQAGVNLKELTGKMKDEAEKTFIQAFDQIAVNFEQMFKKLFGGGQAVLKLRDREDVLNCEIDIMAQPPGKKSEHIASLSGGERSLGGLALLFSIYMLRPSPFCIFDEVDAAMDETNVGRLGTLLKEFEKTSQFIMITHNKRTASVAGSLIGVTMQEQGLSTVVSLKMEENNGKV